MSIKSGRRYKFTNEENGLALDLYESLDNSIIGSDFHGAANQQVTNFATSIACPSYNNDAL
jgi:hypothetical protein